MVYAKSGAYFWIFFVYCMYFSRGYKEIDGITWIDSFEYWSSLLVGLVCCMDWGQLYVHYNKLTIIVLGIPIPLKLGRTQAQLLAKLRFGHRPSSRPRMSTCPILRRVSMFGLEATLNIGWRLWVLRVPYWRGTRSCRQLYYSFLSNVWFMSSSTINCESKTRVRKLQRTARNHFRTVTSTLSTKKPNHSRPDDEIIAHGRGQQPRVLGYIR